MSDDYGVEDGAFSPLRPSHSPGQGGADDGDPFENGDGDVSKLAEVPAAKRKGVKRPQPKLDSQRLISDRGLPALRTLFDNVSFKGKGHEAEDLKLLMQKMENWAHRLFPKLQFEEFIDRVEKLGKKKEVQTCLKRIRLDMPLTHEDYTSKDGEEEEAPESHIFGDPDPFNGPGLPDDLPVVVHSTPAPAAPSLTEEQQRRIELNRQRALERKLARQEQQHTDLSDLQALNSSTTSDKPTSISSASVHKSKDSDEEMEDVNLKSSIQPLDKNSEAAAQSPESEEEDETGCRGENGH